jgi:hypothetical protein
MKTRYTRGENELMTRSQLGLCGGCQKPLGNDRQGHAIWPGDHSTVFGGVELHQSCHTRTPSYGKGQRGLMEYFFGK